MSDALAFRDFSHVLLKAGNTVEGLCHSKTVFIICSRSFSMYINIKRRGAYIEVSEKGLSVFFLWPELENTILKRFEHLEGLVDVMIVS